MISAYLLSWRHRHRGSWPPSAAPALSSPAPAAAARICAWAPWASLGPRWRPWGRWFIYGYGSIPINTIFSGMNIHLPAILMFTRGTRFWPTAILVDSGWDSCGWWGTVWYSMVQWSRMYLIGSLCRIRDRSDYSTRPLTKEFADHTAGEEHPVLSISIYFSHVGFSMINHPFPLGINDAPSAVALSSQAPLTVLVPCARTIDGAEDRWAAGDPGSPIDPFWTKQFLPFFGIQFLWISRISRFFFPSEKISHSHLMLLVSNGWFQIVNFLVDCSTPGFSGSHGLPA